MVYTTKPPFGTQLNLAHPLNNGLAALWIFNEGTGNQVYDLSGNVNNGTLINIASPSTTISGWNPGRLGPCISVDGINDYINVGQPPSLMFTGAMTIGTWIKPNNLTDDWRIVSKQGGGGFRSWSLNVGATGTRNYFQVASDGNTGFYVQGSSGVISEWTHLVAVYVPGVALRLYKNGILDAENKINIPSLQYINNGLDINIGRRPDNILYFPGSIDEVRIYNKALSSQEIQQLYAQPYNMFIDTRKWKCSESPNYTCSQTSDGTYNTEAECITACKECISPTCDFTIY